MTQPLQYRLDRVNFVLRWQLGSLDHHDGNAQRARGLQFGAGATAAGIFGDNCFNTVLAHQRCVIRHRKRAARYDDRMLWQRRRCCRRVNEAQHVVVVRLHGKAFEMLPAYRQQNARGRPGQRLHGTRDVGRRMPLITRLALPRPPRQGDQRNLDGLAGRNCVVAHLGCKRMRGVDDVRDAVFAKVGLQAFDTAKAADTVCNRLRSGSLDASSIGERCTDPGLRHGARKAARFGRAAKDQEVVVHGR